MQGTNGVVVAKKPNKRTRRPGEASEATLTSSKRQKKGSTEPSRKSKADEQFLRSLSRTDRFFWRERMSDQLSQVVQDQHSRKSETRTLAKHEITTLALNEVAAVKGLGLFLYLPSREVWKTRPNEDLAPSCRDPEVVGSRYPSMLYTRFVWSDHTRREFFGSTHRGRYLKANAMFQLLPAATPLYAIQYVHHANFLLFDTTPSSLVVFATSSLFLLASTADSQKKAGRIRGGPEPDKRLQVPPELWAKDVDGDSYGGTIDSLEGLYSRIVERCAPENGLLAPTFSAFELRQIIPHPQTPDSDSTAVTLGTPFAGTSHAAAEPRRKHYEFKNGPLKGKNKLARAEAVEEDGEDGEEEWVGE